MGESKGLIVDADAEYRGVLKEYLTLKTGLRILEADSGAAALDIAASENPSLVLLDILLPDMNGFELCRLFKSSAHLESVPFIIHTVKTGVKDRLEAYRIGARGFVRKPCEPDDVYKCVMDALSYRNN